MANRSQPRPQAAAPTRVRRGYFECRYGQLHLHHAIPSGGGFEEGTTLLALHTATSTGRMFAGLLAAMGADRSAFAPDLPGYGQSDAPVEPLSATDLAAAIGDFLDSMRLRQVDLLGCGLGALVAVDLAQARPGVRRVIVMPPSPGEAEASGRENPLGAQLARLTQPVLALCPREMPPALAREVAELPMRARRELPGGPSLFETAPGVIAEAIREFLS